jgi:hypothetical protein
MTLGIFVLSWIKWSSLMAIKASIVNLLMMMLGEVRRELVHGPEVHAMNIAFSGFSSAVGM